MNAMQEALLHPDINDPLKLPRTIFQGFSDAYAKAKGTSTGGTFTGSLRKPEGYTTYPKNVVLEGNSDAVTTGKELGVTAPGAPKLIGTPITTSPTTDTKVPTTDAPAETPATTPTKASEATNSQADALSNNVNDAENKAKSTMTVQSGSDMGGVNYTNQGGKSTTATTSSDDVMPQENAPQNQQYNSWMQNASTFGTSDENEKQPLTLSKTVYWARRKH